MMATVSPLIASGPSAFIAAPRGRIVAPAHGTAVGALIALAIIVGVALILAAVAWFILSRVVATRRRRAEAMTEVYREVRKATTDALLVHQARRRIRESQARDR